MSFDELVAKEVHRAFDGDIELHESDGRYSLIMRNETGEGSMLFYRVMPGIYLAYCNFSMQSCVSNLVVANDDMLCVDYCKSGRMEQEVGGGAFAYIGAGDLKIDDRRNHTGQFVLPLSEYQGITVSFSIKEAQRSVKGELGGFPVDLGKLRDLELLLFLEMLNPEEADLTRPYYNRTLVAKVKAAHKLMTSDLSHTYTIEEIAERFDIAPTAFKACFKGVYGEPPYRYVKALRMEYAAKMLASGERPVADIALDVGYESPSKFTAAFSDWAGTTPSRFRQGI